MNVTEFLHEIYPHLQLKPPLFYNWNIGIRFELGVEWQREYETSNNTYVTGCYKRAITLFEALHSPTDDIFVVMDINDYNQGKTLKRELNNFSPYVEKSNLYKLNYRLIPYIFPEDDEEGTCRTHRFSLKCKTSELKYIPLLKAICNNDLGIKPRIYHRVYFININKKTIFHTYDDRGCDILAPSPETIRYLYESYNDWILDYDKPEIDKIFK